MILSESSSAARRPDVGICASAEPTGQLYAELQLYGSARAFERLRIGIRSDELYTHHARRDHAIHRVAATTAHTALP